jgi:hypothetical protein
MLILDGRMGQERGPTHQKQQERIIRESHPNPQRSHFTHDLNACHVNLHYVNPPPLSTYITPTPHLNPNRQRNKMDNPSIGLGVR